MPELEFKTRVSLRAMGGGESDSLGFTVPIEIVRAMKLRRDQEIVVEVGEFEERYGMFLVPIRETGA